MNKDIEIAWKKELNDINEKNFPLFIYASVFGILVYSVFDYFSIPNQWKSFFIIRLIFSFIGILLLWMNKKQKISVQHSAIIFISCAYLLFSYGASLQTTNNQLSTWNLSTIVAGLFWPYFILIFSKRTNLILNLFFVTTYLLFYYLYSKFSIQTLLVHGGTLFLFGILASYAINYSKYTMQYNNFKLRYELLLSKNKLEIINNELNNANKVKNKLFSVIAHDLRSPFNSLIGFSDLLLDRVSQTSERELHKYSSIINDELNKTYNYLNNLLEWSRLQSNKIKYQPAVINLNDLVNEIKELLVLQAQNKNINIKQTFEHEIEIYADRNMIKIVLINLVSNAIKFSYSGSDILISCKKSDTQVEILVQDQGVGMSEETIKKLFKVEESYSTQGTNNEKGTGLGLVLSHDFIKKHGGTIDVKSKIAKGSTFRIYLPINKYKEKKTVNILYK